MGNKDYDVLVIGGGPAGENVADVARRSGLRTAVIERELVGGECSYWACMPSKALLRPGQALDEARRVPGLGDAITGDIDLEAALRRRDALSSHWDDVHQVDWLESVDVDLIRGTGRLAGERRVAVESADGSVTEYQASTAVVVATGTSASMPPIDGLTEAAPWDNRDITTIKEAPRRLVVIGGGVIGVEMAQAWKSLGAEEVTIVELFDRILHVEEPFVGDEVRAALEKSGVVVHTGATTTRVDRSATDGPVTVTLETAEGTELSIEADELLVSTGRRPNTGDIGLETVGLEPGSMIEVDDRLRAKDVPGAWLYAVGDVNGRSLLTHTGKYQARIAGAVIAGRATSARGDRVAVPRVVFTSPEVAAVGLTEAQAAERGIDVRTVEYGTTQVAAAPLLGRGDTGTSKLVVDADGHRLVGATFVGPRVGEMLHAATVAIVGEMNLLTLWHAVPAFPTMSEVWLRLLETYRDRYDVALD